MMRLINKIKNFFGWDINASNVVPVKITPRQRVIELAIQGIISPNEARELLIKIDFEDRFKGLKL